MAAGAAGDTDRDDIRGYARVFVYNGADWVPLGGTIVGETATDRAGHGVALSRDGRTLAVGSTYHDGNTGIDSGHVRIYQYESTAGDWLQIGAEIEGMEADDKFGRRIALVGSEENGGVLQLAVGAPTNDGNGENSGHVQYFTLEASCAAEWLESSSNTRTPTAAPTVVPTADPSSCDWIQNGDSLDGRPNDQLGQSVVISGDGKTLTVGSQNPSVTLVDGEQTGFVPGAVRLFSLNEDGSIGPQIGSDIDGEGQFDQAGIFVDISHDGRTVAIGAPTSNNFQGRVRVYRYASGEINDWVQVGPDFLSPGGLGSAVALSSDGSILAIGESSLIDANVPGGRVWVYRLEGGSSWAQIGAALFGDDLRDEVNLSIPRFGSSLAMSDDGTILAVGAPQSNIAGEMSGRVHVFQYNSTKGWSRLGNAINGQAQLEGFGRSLAASADGLTLAVSARPQAGTPRGSVRVYNYDALNQQWMQLGGDIMGDGTRSDDGNERGLTVSLSDDGLVLAVGSPGSLGETGDARVFRFQPSSDDWVRVGTTIPGEALGDQFGSAVSLSVMASRSVLAVGGRLSDRNALSAGQVWVFTIASSCLEAEEEFVAVETQFPDVSIEFVGLRAEMDSDGKTAFEDVSPTWFDGFFLEKVPQVRGMTSSVSVKGQQLSAPSNLSAVASLVVMYSQRISYRQSLSFNMTSEEVLLLPFGDVEAVEEYQRSLTTRSSLFAEIQSPIRAPIILPPPPYSPSVIESSRKGLSVGAIVGIAVGAFGSILVIAYLAFREYKAKLPVAVAEAVNATGPHDSFAPPIAYCIDAGDENLEDVEQGVTRGAENSENQHEELNHKDQVREGRTGPVPSDKFDKNTRRPEDHLTSKENCDDKNSPVVESGGVKTAGGSTIQTEDQQTIGTSNSS